MILSSVLMLISQLSIFAGQNVTLSWNPSSAANVAGYRIYSGPACHCYSNSVMVGPATTATVSGLAPGQTYYFAATTVDNAGKESGFSNETSYTVPLPAAVLTAATTGSGGQFSFWVSAATGQTCVVQASTNLRDWISIQTNTAPFVFTDTNAAGFSQRFYRTCLSP